MIEFNIINFSNKSIKSSQNTSRDVSTHLSPSKIESDDYSENPRRVIILFSQQKKIKILIIQNYWFHLKYSRTEYSHQSSEENSESDPSSEETTEEKLQNIFEKKNNFNPRAIGWETSIPLSSSIFLKEILQPTSSKISPTLYLSF